MPLKSILLLLIIICNFFSVTAQEVTWEDAKLNTAKNAVYMKQDEREMIYEINRLRSDPPRYAKLFVTIQLKNALEVYKEDGRGDSSYSITTSYQDNKISSVDTNWHFSNEEELHALQTLYDTLMHLKPLSILQPDEGIYKACIKHAKNRAAAGSFDHIDTDGTWPWDRILKYSPRMEEGNENLAMNGNAPVRIIVMQLLNDANIDGYGHRYNLLDAKWTHVACYATRPPLMESKWWIQNFGKIKANEPKKKVLKATVR
ncbi:MAG TPA: CAP domain-containing protein [Panacibacter sp.]|nr:CAP domain-containing protein [Panacibacter sp.]